MNTAQDTREAASLDDFYWGVVALAHKDYEEHDRLWYSARSTGATSEQIMAVYTPASMLNDIALFREQHASAEVEPARTATSADFRRRVHHADRP
jgi:hypothetical protein